jgi:cytidine deaminase
MLSKEMDAQMALAALQARKFSYSPYSHFQVGAALLTDDGHLYTGCNIENAAYTPTNCAERTAFFKAVSEGKRHFQAIAIAGGPENAGLPLSDCPPCGVCLQVMMEFCCPDTFEILLVRSETEYRRCFLKDLLPEGFGALNLKQDENKN